ncbi:hypothetical protein [Pseudoxanthomonas mexicana]|uniref:hypothetical protein n=1 Tax=Pseudoxanthomonas mexicana TaxID=128785 RepID=UPI00398B6E26
MELLGFSISKDCISLNCGSDCFDLHNNFDFQGLSYNPINRTLELLWHRGTGNWVKDTDPASLRLDFSGVYLLKAQERDPELPFSEDDCLDTIGFIWDDMLVEMRGYTSNEPKDGCSHLITSFMSGFSIKIGAQSAALHVAGSA